MISAQNDALEKWVTETFIGKEKKKARGVIDRINEINELLGDNDAQFIESVISQKLGLEVTAEEFEKINDLATELQSLSTEETRFGTPSIEYWQKREEMNNYIKSITPTHKLKVATSTIGRG